MNIIIGNNNSITIIMIIIIQTALNYRELQIVIIRATPII